MSDSIFALIELMKRNADAEDMSFGDASVGQDGSVYLHIENCEREFEKVLRSMIGKRPFIVEYVGDRPWDDGGGWTAEYVVGIDGFMLCASHSMPSYCDDECDANLGISFREVSYADLPRRMAEAVQRECVGLRISAVSSMVTTAPGQLVEDLVRTGSDLLPEEIDGVSVQAFLSKLATELRERSVSAQASGYSANAVRDEVDAAHKRRAARDARRAQEAAARVAQVDEFLESLSQPAGDVAGDGGTDGRLWSEAALSV